MPPNERTRRTNGKWVREQNLAERQEIAAHYVGWQISAEPEARHVARRGV
jgi:hypothetical protein